MQKLKVIITGSKVHDVGYRVMLVNKALSYGINNFNTFNTYLNDTQVVIAIIEADDEIIEDFRNFVNNFFPKKAIVENILFEEYRNIVPPIERVMQAFQMEQWGKAIPVLVEMLDKQDKSLDKQDKMLDKQDLHIEITRNGFDDLTSEIKQVDYEVKGIKNEIHMQRDDFKEIFLKEVEELHNEINDIRATLIRMQAA
jgi:acylphosphatase